MGKPDPRRISSATYNRDGVAGVKAHEIEPGRSVPNDWDRALVERWEDRKARRAAERQAGLRQ
jgi:hypothetical protein